MPTIEIDFEVFKQLTLRRETESMSCNDVIRSLLRLPSAGDAGAAAPSMTSEDVWIYKGVRFPVTTEFRARYKGQTHLGKVDREGILFGASRATSPSDAARLVTHNNVNGWNFWECRFPGESRWRPIKALRESSSL